MPDINVSSTLRVSVIIPTYNRAGYLQEALASVFAQTLAPWEVIVIDDGSTDETTQVVQNQPHPLRFYQQTHKGVAEARNVGLREASGDLIAWLDSDDLWETDFLATVVSLLTHNKALDGVYTGTTMIDAHGVRLRSSVRTEPPDRLYEALIRGNFLATPSVVVRKACYDQVGDFDSQLRIAEDYDMWLRLTGEFFLAGIPRPLVRIRVHATNTISDIDGLCQARLTLLEKHFGTLQGNGDALSEISRIAYGYAFRAIATQYIEDGQPGLGWLYLTKATTLHPPILKQLDTFYELALGDQSRKYRGDATRLDIAVNEAQMLRNLDALFASGTARVQALRGIAYGNAYLALAMLSDQAGQWGPARRYILRALRTYPALAFRPGVVRRLVKLVVGRRVIDGIRR